MTRHPRYLGASVFVRACILLLINYSQLLLFVTYYFSLLSRFSISRPAQLWVSSFFLCCLGLCLCNFCALRYSYLDSINCDQQSGIKSLQSRLIKMNLDPLNTKMMYISKTINPFTFSAT